MHSISPLLTQIRVPSKRLGGRLALGYVAECLIKPALFSGLVSLVESTKTERTNTSSRNIALTGFGPLLILLD